MLDVIVAGAGPAGAMAGLVLARAGARVLIVDRASFPRDKLCGDTLNPGAQRLLASLGLQGGPLSRATPLFGMRVSGPRTSVDVRYGGDVHGLALPRRMLDSWLLEAAVAAGARFESGLAVGRVLVDDRVPGRLVRGLGLCRRDGREWRVAATMTIGADGRRSAVARALGLAVSTTAPRRWAYGAYATGISDMADLGEMHVRHGWYVGLAPLGGTLVNLCVVCQPSGVRCSPLDLIRRFIAREPSLADRASRMQFESPARVLGPLAHGVRAVGVPGALLAGDACGFVDPMTGDGLHVAMQRAVLAAREALRVLDDGDVHGAPRRLQQQYAARLGRKLRFQRAVRRLVDSRFALRGADAGARVWSGALRHLVRYAGDVS